MKKARKFLSGIAVTAMMALSAVGSADSNPDSQNQAVLREVCTIVEQNFYDTQMNGVNWQAVCDSYAQTLEAKSTPDAVARHIDEMLSALNTSHTRYLGPDDPYLPIILDVFRDNEILSELISGRFGDTRPQLRSIGILTRWDGANHVVDQVLNNGAAAQKGVYVGDVIVQANGRAFHPTRSLATPAENISLLIRRGSRELQFALPINQAPALDVLNEATRTSFRMIETEGAKIAYMRFWSLAHGAPARFLAAQPYENADALVLDLRGAVGGGGLGLIDLIDPPIGRVCTVMREGTSCNGKSFVGKTVLITDHHTRSAAELFVYEFLRRDLGTTVGTHTAGAVTGGRLFPLSNGGAVYVAVAGLTVGGTVLEGTGIAPEAAITNPAAYGPDMDAQLKAAVTTAQGLVTAAK
jgi:carboxyl-terminal processing protease